jgi:uncharacterized membrane protein
MVQALWQLNETFGFIRMLSVAPLTLLPNKIVIEIMVPDRIKNEQNMFIWALTYKCTFSNIISKLRLIFSLLLIKNIFDKNEANCPSQNANLSH